MLPRHEADAGLHNRASNLLVSGGRDSSEGMMARQNKSGTLCVKVVYADVYADAATVWFPVGRGVKLAKQLRRLAKQIGRTLCLSRQKVY